MRHFGQPLTLTPPSSMDSQGSFVADSAFGEPTGDPDEVVRNPFLAEQPPEAMPAVGKITPSSGAAGPLSLAAMGSAILGNILHGMAAVQAGDFNADIATRNATLSRMAAGDAIARGHIAAQVALLRGAQTASSQTAAYAGAGVSVKSGSAVQAKADTSGMSAFDALVAENDAARTAWGYTERGRQFQQEAAIERSRGLNQLGESILGGARTAGSYSIERQLQIG